MVIINTISLLQVIHAIREIDKTENSDICGDYMSVFSNILFHKYLFEKSFECPACIQENCFRLWNFYLKNINSFPRKDRNFACFMEIYNDNVA